MLAAILVSLLFAPPDMSVEGYASAYAEGVFADVVRYRLDNDVWPYGKPPVDWYTAAGYIASMDCSHVGSMATLEVGGVGYRVLVADCAGPGDPERFTRMNVVAELDWRLWERFTALHGRPLPITVHYD